MHCRKEYCTYRYITGTCCRPTLTTALLHSPTKPLQLRDQSLDMPGAWSRAAMSPWLGAGTPFQCSAIVPDGARSLTSQPIEVTRKAAANSSRLTPRGR
jgi:hypothetical protein